MLNELTKEQEDLMSVVAQEWKDRFFNTKRINEKQFEDGIKWLYCDLLKKDMPTVIYCESWLGALIAIDLLKNKGASVRSSVGDSVGSSVRSSVGDSVRSSVRSSVGDSVWDSVWASVRASVWDSVWASVGASVSDSVVASVGASVWASVSDSVGDSVRAYSSYTSTYLNFGWVSFYDYFEKIGILSNDEFRKYKDLIGSGVFQAYEYEKYVFAIQPPKHIHLDDEGRMNSTSEKAFEWSDGYGFHYVSGCGISEELFEKLKTDSLTVSDFLSESNEEVKSAIISYIQQTKGDAGIMTFFSEHLKEVDTYTDIKSEEMMLGTTNGQNIGVYTLFKGELNGIDVAYVRCFCPSTDRMFFLGVHPDNTNAKDAIASLYQVPVNLREKIVSISRQGEKFSTIFDDETTAMLESGSIDIGEYVSLSGDDYFRLMSYEY